MTTPVAAPTALVVQPVPAALSTYKSFYQEASVSKVPYEPEMQSLLQRVAQPTGNVRQHLKDMRNMPLGYGLCLKGSDHMIVVHRTVYMATTLKVALRYQNCLLAFASDVSGNQLPALCRLPQDLLGVTNVKFRVPPLEVMVAALRDDPSLMVLPAVDPAAADPCDELVVRKGILFPPECMWNSLEGPVPVRDMFLQVYNGCSADSGATMAIYKPVLDALRVAMVADGRTYMEFDEPMDVTLRNTKDFQDLTKLVREDLPGWNKLVTAAAPPAAAAPPPMAPAAPINAPAADTTPSQRWKMTWKTLLSLMQVRTEEELAPVWHALAACKQFERTTVLQIMLDEMAEELGSNIYMAPKVLTTFAEAVFSLKFTSPNADRLWEGVQPFHTPWLEGEQAAQAQDLQTVGATLNNGVEQSTETFFQLRQEAYKRLAWPLTFDSMMKTLKAFGVVLATLCGQTSGIFVSYEEAFMGGDSVWRHAQFDLQQQAQQNPDIFACLLMSVQRDMHLYWSQLGTRRVKDGGAPRLPGWGNIVDRIFQRQWIPPALPGSMFKPAPAATIVPKTVRWGSATGGSSVASGLTMGTTAPGSAAGRSTTRYSPPPARPPPGGRSSADTVTAPTDSSRPVVWNTTPSAAIKDSAGRLANARLREFFRKAASPPKLDGVELCGGYHIKNKCFEGCDREATHRPLTDAEVAKYCQFLTTEKERQHLE